MLATILGPKMQLLAHIGLQRGRKVAKVDEMASAEPHRIIYSVAILSDISHEFRHISARTFAKAVDKSAW